jgi:hypothetical protein
MNFPHREAEIRALAQNIIAGLTENADFPNPPIAVSELRNLLDAFINQSDAQVAAQAAAQQATEGKRDAQDRLVGAMKTNLHYAEDAAQGNDAKLAVLGWGARANPGPPAVPGQPRLLETVQQSAGWLHLDWKRPAGGGIVSYYTVKRRERAAKATGQRSAHSLRRKPRSTIRSAARSWSSASSRSTGQAKACRATACRWCCKAGEVGRLMQKSPPHLLSRRKNVIGLITLLFMGRRICCAAENQLSLVNLLRMKAGSKKYLIF